jgi:hypothetical protein
MVHLKGILIWIGSLFALILSALTKSDITFGLGVIVSMMAIVYYFVMIRKNLKQNK